MVDDDDDDDVILYNMYVCMHVKYVGLKQNAMYMAETLRRVVCGSDKRFGEWDETSG